MTIPSPLPRRRAAQIYAVTVLAGYGALAAFAGVARLMDVPILKLVGLFVWWVAFAGAAALASAMTR